MRGKKVYFVAQVALFSAVICLLSMIYIPFLTIPITFQNFAIFITLFLCDGAVGLCSIAVYVAIGAVGMPVFSGFRGGVGALFGTSGGFIWGFLIIGAIFFFCTVKRKRKIKYKLYLAILSQAVLYVVGTLWYCVGFADNTSFFTVLTVTVLPFVLPDSIKIALAYFLAKKIIKLRVVPHI